MKNLKIVIILLLSVIIFQSCVDDRKEKEDLGTAPQLPPVESFVIPFTDYEDADTTGFAPTGGDEDGAETRTPTFQNWFHGATNVLVWNAAITLNTIIPKAAFLESFNHDPEGQGSGVWLWEYDFTDNNNNTYTAKLYGEILDLEEVKWDMYISKANGFQDVLWYTGTTSETQALWTLNHQPNNPEPFLQIERQKENGSGEASIKYTNIVPNNPGNGDYIEHRIDNTGTADFNRAYDIFKASNDHLIEIQWNRPEGNGRVKDEVKFGNMEWQCWDENKQDIEC